MDGELRRAAGVAALQADGTPDTETIGSVHTPLGGEVLCCNRGPADPFFFSVLMFDVLKPALLFFLFNSQST